MSRHWIVRAGLFPAAALLLAGVVTVRGQEPPPELQREIDKTRAELERNRAVQAELEVRLRVLQTRAEAAVVAQKHGKDEVHVLVELIREREKRIDELQQQVRDQQQKTMEHRYIAQRLQGENEQLLRQMKRLTEELGRLKQQAPPGEKKPENPSAPNPPACRVRGTVLEVNPKDERLITISQGTDHGVEVGHTLEVYRLRPEPRYLGMVRVVDVQPQRAVARLEGRGAAKLQPGDSIASDVK